MRYLNLIIAFMLCQPIFSQNLPDISSLLSIQPKWSYVSEDTNWYQIQFDNSPHFDKYYGTFNVGSKITDKYYYLLEAATGQTHKPPLIEGYFLHKINLKTGEPEWVHYDNFFSGNDFVETVLGGNMSFDQDGNIEINGFKSLDSIKNITFDNFDFSVYVNVMRDVIDNNTGQLLEHRVDLDTSRTKDKLQPGGFLLWKAGNNRQIKHLFENVFEDGFVRNYLHLYDVNEDGIVSNTPVFSYKHTTIIDFNATFLSYGNRYFQLNENYGVALFGSIDQTQGNIPSNLKLVFFDTSNSPSINIVQEKNILDLLPDNLDKGTGTVEAFANNEYFCLYQEALTMDNENSFEQFIWLKWFDLEGNLMQEIDRLQVDDMDMDAFVRGFFVDDELYLLCKKNEGGPSGEDIYYLIKSDKDNSIQKLASFTKPKEFDEYSIFFNSIQILENNDVTMYLNINYPSGDLTRNASFLCRYDGNDFGLTTTAIQEEETDKTAFVSPNPATDYISLNTTNNQTISNISIIDVLGNSRPYNTSSENQLDVSDLIPGNYFVQYHQNDKLVVLPFVKI